MKKFALLLLSLALWAAVGAGCAFATPPEKPQGSPPGGHGGPPPEAYEACEGKSAGDVVAIETPRGDTIEGVCEDHDGTLAFRPSSPPPGRPGGDEQAQ